MRDEITYDLLEPALAETAAAGPEVADARDDEHIGSRGDSGVGGDHGIRTGRVDAALR
jgi:hypothetical protein